MRTERLAASCLVVLSLWGLGSRVRAGTKPPAASSPGTAKREVSPGSGEPASIAVQPLRDAGGAGEKGPDGASLNVRLTRGLEAYLGEAARGRLRLVPASAQPDFSAQGEISKPDTAPAGAGPYLLVLRLFREGKSRQLIGQWAGVADTVRDLSGNILRDPRVDPNGLTGELCKRAIAAAVGGSWPQMESFDKLLGTTRATGVEAKVLPAPGGGYRIEVKSDAAGTVFVVGMRAGVPRALLLSEAPQVVDLSAGKAVVLPTQKTFALEEPASIGPREVVVLVRRKAAEREVLKTTEVTPSGNEPSVRIIEGGKEPAGEAGVTRILQLATADTPGLWRAVRMPLHLLTSPLDAYKDAKADPTKLQLAMEPKKASVKVKEEVFFKAKVATDGFLVVVAHGASGTIRLLHPLSRKFEDAAVKAGSAITLPADSSKAYVADRAGTERVRAFLFPSRDAAAALLEVFSESLTITPNPIVVEKANGSNAKAAPLVSEVSFKVEG